MTYNVYYYTVPMGLVEIPEINDEVTLWGVRGCPGKLFPTKMAAEMYARNTFPLESEQQRYSRIFLRTYIATAVL